ncbi:MAG: type II toxin-antitoxin system RelE/ParE family toxin [Flavobacteriales bacterium]|nr:type II toxin-antitoxin system RelE/ParE family toxin [Flavobacteriales bacterium]
MNRPVVIHPKAIIQAGEIHRYYLSIKPELADRFYRELDAVYVLIEHSPAGHQIRFGAYRHALVKGFRIRVVYAIRDDAVVVYQVRHTSRRVSKRFGP